MAACEAGYDVLLKQGSVDVVEHAIKRLEGSQFLNAGVGSYLQLDGRICMDASIMKDDSSAGTGLAMHTIHRSWSFIISNNTLWQLKRSFGGSQIQL